VGKIDKIKREKINNMVLDANIKLFNTLNDKLKNVDVPGELKKAVIISILKQDKYPSKKESNILVRLTHTDYTQHTAQTMERMIANEKINRWQAGFHKWRITEEELSRLHRMALNKNLT